MVKVIVTNSQKPFYTHINSMEPCWRYCIIVPCGIITHTAYSIIEYQCMSGISTYVYGISPICVCVNLLLTVCPKSPPVSVFEHQFWYNFHHIIPRYHALYLNKFFILSHLWEIANSTSKSAKGMMDYGHVIIKCMDLCNSELGSQSSVVAGKFIFLQHNKETNQRRWEDMGRNPT